MQFINNNENIKQLNKSVSFTYTYSWNKSSIIYSVILHIHHNDASCYGVPCWGYTTIHLWVANRSCCFCRWLMIMVLL